MYGGTGEVMLVYLKMENPFYPTQDNLITLGKKYGLDLPDKEMTGFNTDNLYNQIKQKDEIAAELYNLINEKGYEEAWNEITNKYDNEQLLNTNIDLNDISDFAEPDSMHLEYLADVMKDEYGIEPIIQYDYEEMTMDRLTNLGEKGDEWGEAIQKEGYDGVDAGDELVVFEPTQIKSAVYNSGTYNETDSNIHKA